MGDIAAATFVGLELSLPSKKWTAQAIGDSFLFFIRRGKEIISLPKIEKDTTFHFGNTPNYLVSDGNHKGEMEELKDQDLEMGTFYLMTDALASWLLQEIDDRLPLLEALSSEKAFQDLVERERNQQRLQDDDTTLLIITIEKNISRSTKIIKFLRKRIKKLRKYGTSYQNQK